MSASYYQTQLDSINAAITTIEGGALECRLADGRMVRNHQLDWMYTERARLEDRLALVSRTGGGVSISRGAAF